MQIINQLSPLRHNVSLLRKEGARIALVPTMGALHDGHMALVDHARRHADAVVVSIFVNPTQFGPNEDLDAYPRTFERDSELLRAAGVDILWAPTAATVYPQGFATKLHVDGPSRGYCGGARPGHFDGVALVVAKLFNQVQPDVALFGEKDFQQLAVIRRMVTDLQIPVQVIGAPTVRASDGLALSSRNQYLLPEERELAPRLYQQLVRVAELLKSGENSREDIARHEAESRAALKADGFKVEYFSVRSAETLHAPSLSTEQMVILVAARIGKARLIDNVQVELA